MSLRVSVETPTLNPAQIFETQYSLLNGEVISTFRKFMSDRNLNADEVPNFLETCAGDGPLATIAKEMGITDITCIDMHIPRQPLVPEANWLYWDLCNLVWNEVRGFDQEPEVEALRGKFDVVALTNSTMPSLGRDQIGRDVCRFFASQNAYIFCDW